MKKILLSFAFLATFFTVHSQCTNTSSYGSAVAPTAGTTTISTIQYQTEYSTISSVVNGNTYESAYSAGGCITVHSGTPGGPVVASGNSPLNWTANTNGNYYVHYTLDCGGCATATTGNTSTISCVSCVPPPATGNDDPCIATPLTVSTACTYVNGTNVGATSTAGVPAPGCASYTGADVWFTAVVPASGSIAFDSQTGSMTDAGMAVYSAASCAGPFTLMDCDDDGSANGAMSATSFAGLTPGQTLYIRFWDYGGGTGTFGICANEPPSPPPCGTNPAAGNTCATATPICDLNGYCGTTAATYTDNSWAQLDAAFSGSIENNSFISFVAGGPTMSFDVFTFNCSSTSGIQIEVFSAVNCTGAVTEFLDWNPGNDNDVTLTVNGLTAGNTYYIMIDGNGGAVCDYVIGANTGVSLPVNAGPDVSICAGQSAPLTATGGDGTYSWTPTGTLNTGTGANVTATPVSTTTYTVTSGGGNPLCPTSLTDDVVVTVNNGGDLSMTGTSAPSGNVGPAAAIALNICNGGSATLNAAGGTTYTWAPATGLSSTTGASVTANPTVTTVYTITSVNAAGCPFVGQVTVNVTPAPIVTVNSGTICAGDNITLTAGGMNTYSWAPAAGLSATTGTSVVASPTTTQTYTVTGSTPGCPNDNETSTVTVNPLPVPSFSITGNQCLSTNSVTFTNTGTAGTYSWAVTGGTPATGTANSVTSTFASAGTFNVTLTTTVGTCTDAVTIPVTINPDPTVSITPTQILCNGVCDGQVVAAGAGTSGYSYNWGATGTGATQTGLCPGPYTVTVTDINGCTATANTTLTQPTVLAVSATPSPVSCNGICDGSITSAGAGGTGVITYTWTGGLTGQNPTGVCDGTYTVTATDANMCTATAIATVSEPTVLTVSATPTAASCNGVCDGSITSAGAGGTGAITYTWTGGLTGQNPTGVCDGSYTVTATDANSCTVAANAAVTEPTAITASIVTQTDVLCNGASTGSVTIGGAGSSGTFNYDIGGGNQASGTFTGLTAGTYIITVSDAANVACNTTVNVTITEPAALTATIALVTVACNGDCDGQAVVVAGGGSGGFTYAWDNTSFDATATTTANLCAGTYNVIVADAADATCTATQSITVTEPTAITLVPSSTAANCGVSDGTAGVVASGGSGVYTNYNWTPAPGAGQGTANVTGLAAGSYTVVVTDDNLCTQTIIVNVPNNTAPSISEVIASHLDVLCNGASTGVAEVIGTGGTGTLTYAWTPSGGTGTSATGLAAGTYTVTVSDANSCNDAITITITEPAVLNAVANVTTDVVCNGDADGTATVNVSGGVTTYTYQWFDSANTAITGGTNAPISGLAAGNYYVVIMDGNSCTSTSNTITITEPTPLTVAGVETPAGCNGAATGSIDLTPGGGDGAYSFAWTGPSGFTSNVEDPSGLVAGTYNVIVTDGAGCTSITAVTVTEPTLLIVSGVSNSEYCGQANGDVTATAINGTATYTYEWFSDAGLSASLGNGANLGSLAAGTYYMVATDNNGCTANSSVVVAAVAGPTVSAVVDSDATGPGLCNGSGTATGTGGTGVLTYLWGNSNTNVSATDLCQGNNCVTVTDAQGCTATDCITINEPTGVTVVIVGVNLDCNGACIGEADVTATGGVGGYTYLWDHGPTAEDLTGLCAGTFNVTVTDANGNIGTGSVIITEPVVLSITSTTPTAALCNGICDGSVTTVAAGGTGTIAYEWFDATPVSIGATATVGSLCAGTYDLVVTDDNGCIQTQNAVVIEPTAITLTPNAVNSNCGQADGSVSVVALGGTVATDYTYAWTDAASATVGTAASVSSLVAGTYTVVVTDDNGCTETVTATISDVGGATLTESHINTNCNGSSDGSINLTIIGGTGPFVYTWTGPNGYTATSQDLSILEAGTYNVTVTDAVNCVATTSVIITEPTIVAVTPSSVPTVCFGGTTGSVSVTATGGTGAITFGWFDDVVLSNNIGSGTPVNGLAAGTYYVTATDANGCSVDNLIVVTEPADIAVTVTSADANCGQADGTISVTNTVGGSGTYTTTEWFDATSTLVTTPGAVAAGAYTVVVTDDQGCTGTANVTVNDLVGPNVSLVSAAIVSCNGLCDGNALINTTGGTAGYTYVWAPAPGTGQGTNSITGLCAGDYSATITDANGCIDNIIVTILEPAPLEISITGINDVTINGASDGDISSITVGGTPAYSYAWYTGCPPGALIGQTTANASALASGDYSVIVTDAKGCLDTACATVNEPTTITLVDVITNTSCFNGCDGTISITASGGVPGYSYEWYDAATSLMIGQNGNNATGLCAGDYYIVVEDLNGAIQTSINYTVGQPTQIAIVTSVTSNFNGSDISCNGLCDGIANAAPTGGTAPYTYLWGAGAANQASASANNLCDGTYTVTVTDNNNCIVTQTITLTEPVVVSNVQTQTDNSCNAACDGVVNATVSGGTGIYTYLWNDPLLSSTASVTGLCADDYDVVITDANGCNITESYTITEPVALVLGSTTQGSNCGLNDGSATVTIVSGAAPYTYLWDVSAGSATTAVVGNLFAGCYDVTVTDVNGCSELLNICVQDLGAPTVTLLSQTDVSCNGGNDGFAQIQVTDGIAPYVYTWTDCAGTPIGQTTASALSLTAGCYTGTMIDNVGCAGNVSVTITEPTVLNSVMSNSSDVTCFGFCDGTATATVGGGTAPYTYAWNDAANQTTATATGLCPGNYSVDVFDANLCTQNITVTINEPVEITLTTATVDAFCATATGSASVTVTAGGVGAFDYLWTPSGLTTATAGSLTPGAHNVQVTDIDGCIQTAVANVADIPAGTATIGTISNVSCFGGADGSISVSMSGTGTAPYTYQWFNVSGTSIAGQTNAIATGLIQGTYYVEVTDANGCLSVSNQDLVTEPTLLTTGTIQTDANCFAGCDGTADALAAGGTFPYTYLWNDPLNQTTITASGLCAGSVDVQVTDNNGCIINATAVIGEPTIISIDSTVTNSNCGQPDGNGCVIASGGTGAYTYLWPSGSTNSCDIDLAAATYIVSVFDQNNCQQQISVEVQDLGGPVAGITGFTDVSCNAFCDGQATVDMTAGNGTSFTVQWDAGTTNQTTPTASNLCAGNYAVTITDNLGCNASTSVIIGEPDLIQYNITPTFASCFAYCDGEADITVIGGTLPYTYTWLDNGNNPIGTNTNNVAGLCAGTFGINLVDAQGCTFTDNFSILQPMEVVGTIIPQNISCFGACDGIGTASATVGVAPYSYQWDAAAGNQSGAAAQNLCPGTYTVTITDADGCFNTADILLTEPTLLTSNISLNGNVTCNGFCDGFAEVSGAGGSAPYSYLWDNNGGNAQLATNLCAGTYNGTITDANGCTTVSNVIVTEPQPLSAITNVVPNTCFNSCDGEGSVNVTGGTAPYSYQWDNSTFATTPVFTNECVGTYNVTVTDANGCQIFKTVTILQPNQLVSNVTITNSNCGQNNGQLCTTTNGGTFPYSYQWNDPNTQTGACALSLLGGCYSLTVTDGNACVMDTLICLNDIVGPTVTGVNTVDVTCFGALNGSVEFTVSGGTGIVVNEIVNGAGIPVLNGTLALSLNGDCYTLFATDAAGCVASDVLCVLEPNALNSAVIQSTDALCNLTCDGTATSAANGGTAPYAFSWNGGTSPATAFTDGLCAGAYTVTITDDNNCTSQSNILIEEPLPVSITAVVTDVNCFSGSDGVIDATYTGGTQPYLYTWTAGGQTSPDISNLLIGTYFIDVIDANGCHGNENYTVVEPTIIDIALSSLTAPSCEMCNGIIAVNATGGVAGYSYAWNTGTTPNSSLNSGFCPGTHDVTVTDAQGCLMSVSYDLLNQASPEIDSITTIDPLCNGLSNGSATVYSHGTFASSTFTYLWDAAANGQTSQTANAFGDGTYCVTVMDPNGCVASQCATVIEPSQLNAIPDGSNTICYGDSTQIWASGQGGTAPYIINWVPVGITGQGPILVEPVTSTDYCFTVTDAQGCISVAPACVNIIVRDSLTIDLTPSTSICEDGSINLTALGFGGVVADYNFDWTEGPTTTIADVENGNQSVVSVMPTTVTWYYVTLSDGCSLDQTDSTEISVSPNPITSLVAVDSAGCEAFEASFIGNSDIGVIYEYDIDCDGVNEYSGGNSNFNYTFTSAGQYDVCLNVISAAGCSTLISNPTWIEVYPNPVADFVPDPLSTTFLTPYITFNDNSIGGDLYSWDFGDNLGMAGDLSIVYDNEFSTDGSILQPTHTFSDTGYYDVTLTIETQYGCTSSYTQTVFIEGDYTFYTPNAFTPDGDGINDTFKPLGIGIDRDDYTFYIFNRWGQMIFEGYNPDDVWDGKFKNQMSQQDVYVWKVITKDNEGTQQEYIGHVTLIK